MTHTHYRSHQPSPLDLREMAEFDASIADESEFEQRRRRIIYLRDAIRQQELGSSLLKGFGCMMIPFYVIPLFWPVLIFFHILRKKGVAAMESQLESALQYWGIRREELDQPESVARPISS